MNQVTKALLGASESLTPPTAHTPGPWKITEIGTGQSIASQLFGTLRYIIADIEPLPDAEETFANARLIAAAPELLAALENVIAVHYGNKGLRGECDNIGWVRNARAAIVKAKGGAK